MLVKTLDEYRALKAALVPLWAVQWLPYLDSPNRTDKNGSEEEIYTTFDEAQTRFSQLAKSESLVETVALKKWVGGMCYKTLDEWYDDFP